MSTGRTSRYCASIASTTRRTTTTARRSWTNGSCWDKTTEGDPLDWTLAQLRTRMPDMTRRAGYEDLAGRIDDAAFQADLDAVEYAARTMAARAAQHRAPRQGRSHNRGWLRKVRRRVPGARERPRRRHPRPRRRGRRRGGVAHVRLLRGRAPLPLRPHGQEPAPVPRRHHRPRLTPLGARPLQGRQSSPQCWTAPGTRTTPRASTPPRSPRRSRSWSPWPSSSPPTTLDSGTARAAPVSARRARRPSSSPA